MTGQKQVTYKIDESLELKADNNTQVEIQKELGFKDRYKLYVHHNGKTIVRICQLKDEQFNVSALVD